MREMSDEIIACRQLLETAAPGGPVAATPGDPVADAPGGPVADAPGSPIADAGDALARVGSATSARGQLDAALALEAALRSLAAAHRPRRDAVRSLGGQLAAMANRWRGLADNLAGDLPDILRIFGSFPESGRAAGDIDLISTPLSDSAIESLAAAHAGARDDMRWRIPHADLPLGGAPGAHLAIARTLAQETGLPADVFFGSNAFGEFVLAARLDPDRDIWTVTDRWAPCLDFFDGQRTASLDELRAYTRPAPADT